MDVLTYGSFRVPHYIIRMSMILNKSNHPEEDDVISDDDKNPEEIASAELRANRRRGYEMHHSMKLIQASFRELDHQSPLLPHSREL